MKILFVENHARFAETVSKLFLNRHEVVVEATITAAQNSIAKEKFDVVLVDYDLNDGKGNTFIRMLRLNDNMIPIVAVSSHARGNQALLDAGANVVCEKLKFKNINHVLNSLCNIA